MKNILVILSVFISQIAFANLICDNSEFRFTYAANKAELFEKAGQDLGLIESSNFVKDRKMSGEMGDYHFIVYLSGKRLTSFQIIDHSFVETAIDNKIIENLECTGIW